MRTRGKTASAGVLLALLVGGGPALAEVSLEVGHEGAIVLADAPDSIPVTITAPETPETRDRPLRVSVNVGTFGPVERTGPGTYVTAYHPPKTRFPQLALVAVWLQTIVKSSYS